MIWVVAILSIGSGMTNLVTELLRKSISIGMLNNYSWSKSITEQAVLTANNSILPRGRNLKVCALRCAGIYGEGNQRHLPRIVVSKQFILI